MKDCRDRERRNIQLHQHIARPHFTHMVFMFTLIVSVILALTMLIVTGVMLLLNELKIISLPNSANIVLPIVIWVLSSLAIGIVTAALISRIPLRPFKILMAGMNSLAQGDYSVRLHLPFASVNRKLSESFNALATELENTEMLRTDFVNNFSHEFKTPIVSMLGFAKLLKRTDLPPDKREEYLNIILSEGKRLTDMADNVLNLAKIEKQSILTEIEEFNVSEQIRTCMLLLEKKWEQKKLEIQFDEYEYHCTGNQELLKQVWINLLDNAIKFAPEGSLVKVSIVSEPDTIAVSFASAGEAIGEEARKRIFEKFYQGDSSHATEGTGLGLAIVKKIIELHKGTIMVEYLDGCNVFTVTLPDLLPIQD
jgi:signal transduction histidine kinase